MVRAGQVAGGEKCRRISRIRIDRERSIVPTTDPVRTILQDQERRLLRNAHRFERKAREQPRRAPTASTGALVTRPSGASLKREDADPGRAGGECLVAARAARPRRAATMPSVEPSTASGAGSGGAIGPVIVEHEPEHDVAGRGDRRGQRAGRRPRKPLASMPAVGRISGQLAGERRRALAVLAGEQDVDADRARRRRRMTCRPGRRARSAATATVRAAARLSRSMSMTATRGLAFGGPRQEHAHRFEGQFAAARHQAGGVKKPEAGRQRRPRADPTATPGRSAIAEPSAPAQFS